jgi:hypothetical protein
VDAPAVTDGSDICNSDLIFQRVHRVGARHRP